MLKVLIKNRAHTLWHILLSSGKRKNEAIMSASMHCIYPHTKKKKKKEKEKEKVE